SNHHHLRDFFSHPTPTPEIYTLSLHDALPIFRAPGARRRGRLGHAGAARCHRPPPGRGGGGRARLPVRGRSHRRRRGGPPPPAQDRKSTRLNSSHVAISYAVFCLKRKNRGIV